MKASGTHRRSSATPQGVLKWPANFEEPGHMSNRTSSGQLPSPPDWENSRDSVAGAGWGGAAEDLSALMPPALQDKPAFSWLRLKSLTGGRRNDPLAKLLSDPSPERRRAWLNQMYGDGVPDLTIDRTDLDGLSFLLLGDTGEGDISQYAPMSIIDTVAPGTDFMVILSASWCLALDRCGLLDAHRHKQRTRPRLDRAEHQRETAFATDVTYELTLTVPGTAAHVITVVRRRTLGPQMVLAADRPARQTS
jgi:hypothetical protein